MNESGLRGRYDDAWLTWADPRNGLEVSKKRNFSALEEKVEDFHTTYFSGDHIKEKLMGGVCGTHGGEEMCVKGTVEKTWVKEASARK
jgi:hypothetical protein